MSSFKDLFWVERYRPTTIDDYIFHDQHQRLKMEEMVATKNFPHILMSGVQGSGKAQPLTSKVHTPTGWRLMGELEVGDWVSTPTGGLTSIIGVFPQGNKEIYTITFHDGSKTECCLDHLWECYYIDNFSTRLATKHIVDTKTIMEYMNQQSTRKSGKFNVSIPMTQPVIFNNNITLTIPPYIMGVLLGDGSLCGESPRITSIDTEITDKVQDLLSEEYQVKTIANSIKEHIISQRHPINYGGKDGTSENLYTSYLKQYEIHNKRSHEKFIPEDYLVSTVESRFELLRGLLDTDGTVGKKGDISYVTTSEQLALDVQQLVWSLGGTCTIKSRFPTYTYKGIKKQGRLAYTLHIAHSTPSKLFSLSRKVERCGTTFAENHSKGNVELRRRIMSIEFSGVKPARCIMVNDPKHLYITDDYIVTHNTTAALILINELNISDSDVLTINASDENSVDVIRDRIRKFATSAPMGEFKVVLLEEADYITLNGQGALRYIMEDNAETCRFILTCNYEHKIIPAIISRCTVKFRFKSPDKVDITEYLANVLVQENIKFKLDVLDKFIAAGYPDIRNILSTIQQYCIDGQLQSPATLESNNDYKFQLLDLITKDKWIDARKIVCEQITKEEYEDLYTFLYRNIHMSTKFKKQELWEEAIIIIADHLYKHNFVADPEINAAAMFIELGRIK